MSTFYRRPDANTPRCRAPGCGRPMRRNPFARLGPYSGAGLCERCRGRVARHGHVNQVPLKKHEVTKTARSIERLLKRRGSWERVQASVKETATLLAGVVHDPEYTRPIAADGKTGPFVYRWRVKAKDAVLKVLEDTDAVESGLLVAAMFLLRDWDSRRFCDEQSFRAQLVRRWRAQSALSCGSYYDAKLNRVLGWYKPLPPRVVQEIALLLVTAYSRFASLVITADHRDKTKKDESRSALDAAFISTRVCASPPWQTAIYM